MHMSAWEANVLGAFALALADRLGEAAEPAGGTTAAEALVALNGTAAGGSIDSLARIVALSHSGTVRLVDRLARDGLVERRRGADQRSAALILTPQGRRAARQVLSRREANLQFLISSLTDDQRRAGTEFAEALLAAIAGGADAESRVCRLCDLEACGRSRGRCPVKPAAQR